MDQAVAKKTLQELIKREELKNKICNDCTNPNPQWASLSFAVFLCLQCAGVHRGFGVHISFVRSVSMDTWQEEQIRRMTFGGNAPFQTFMESYTPADQGGYKPGCTVHEKYHCWAAAQYKSKIDADLAGQTFTPSAPPPDASGIVNPPGRPDSAQSLRSGPQGLRKSRANMRTNTGDRLDSPSRSNTPLGTPQSEQKSANESYFANLGDANASRPADLPPSQGGKYQGFGSTPAPDSPGHPSYGLSSRAAPSLNELQENPMAALSKGWSLFSAAVSGATRAVSENVIQPGMERVLDPTLQANVRGYVSGAGKRAGDLGKTANEWSKTQFGVDVADQVGGVVGTVRERIGGGPESNGYGAVPHHYEGDSGSLYEDEDDFFREHAGETSSPATTSAPAVPPKTPAKKDEWDEWKDF